MNNEVPSDANVIDPSQNKDSAAELNPLPSGSTPKTIVVNDNGSPAVTSTTQAPSHTAPMMAACSHSNAANGNHHQHASTHSCNCQHNTVGKESGFIYMSINCVFARSTGAQNVCL